MNGSEELLKLLIVLLVGFAAGLFTKNRYYKRRETRYRENGKH